MIRNTFAVLICLLFSITMLAQSNSDDFIPKGVPNYVSFGMSVADFEKKAKKVEKVDDSMPFRVVFSQEMKAKGIDEIIYYFDADERSQPLYEIIIVYDNLKKREKAIRNKFNEDTEEWSYALSNPYPVDAWIFKNKLVVVAKIPGTEWAE